MYQQPCPVCGNVPKGQSFWHIPKRTYIVASQYPFDTSTCYNINIYVGVRARKKGDAMKLTNRLMGFTTAIIMCAACAVMLVPGLTPAPS